LSLLEIALLVCFLIVSVPAGAPAIFPKARFDRAECSFHNSQSPTSTRPVPQSGHTGTEDPA
jgi:hypothetical protein